MWFSLDRSNGVSFVSDNLHIVDIIVRLLVKLESWNAWVPHKKKQRVIITILITDGEYVFMRSLCTPSNSTHAGIFFFVRYVVA